MPEEPTKKEICTKLVTVIKKEDKEEILANALDYFKHLPIEHDIAYLKERLSDEILLGIYVKSVDVTAGFIARELQNVIVSLDTDEELEGGK